MRQLLGPIGAFLLCTCASTQAWKPPSAFDTSDDPNALRPGFGNGTLHTWWPVTGAEIAALNDLDRAKQGDPHALLALAILASGDKRDPASYAGYQRKVDQFVSEIGPSIAAATDEWHRGYELHRAMHRVFFKAERGELGSYELRQSRVTGILDGGRYNCISSAMLFAVLARSFELPVRAVLVPTHVFIEMGAPGGKIIEVETTSATGFDWVHDERFYREEAAGWSSRRGLGAVTMAQYQSRAILEPHRLMSTGMRNTHPGESEQDRFRLNEIAALVDPGDVELQKGRIGIYVNEANDLLARNAWRTMAKLFDTVGPGVSEIAARSKDAMTLSLACWTKWYHARALQVVGRSGDAMALMSDGLEHLDATWPEADKLRTNFVSVLDNALGDLINKKDNLGASQLFIRHRDVCRSEKVCAGNAGILYGNWAIEHQNAGDWQSARKVLQECVAQLPEDERCRDALKDLESRHRF